MMMKMGDGHIQIEKKHIWIVISALAIFAVVGFFALNSYNNLSRSSAEHIAINNGNIRIANIALPGMFCKFCAKSSESAFKGMVGVIDAQVDIKTKKGVIVYDFNKITKEELVADGLIRAYRGSIITDKEYKR